MRILVSVTDGVNNISGAVSAQASAKGASRVVAAPPAPTARDVYYAVNSKSTGTGTYSVNASASKSGYVSASDSTTFLVQ